jgi:hypothetical protein
MRARARRHDFSTSNPYYFPVYTTGAPTTVDQKPPDFQRDVRANLPGYVERRIMLSLRDPSESPCSVAFDQFLSLI